MIAAAIEAAALALPGAALSVQWGEDRVFKVADKMFAVLGVDAARGPTPHALSIKVDDLAFEMLSTLPGVRPAPYLARAKWVQITDLGALPKDELLARLKASYALVVAKLPKRLRPA